MKGGDFMSLKGTEKDISLKDIPKLRKAVADKNVDVLAKYVESGAMSTEVYNQLIEEFGAIPCETTKDKKWHENTSIKWLRNVLAILIGLITYLIMEKLTAIIFLFMLKIPVLSFLMTGYVPIDIFLSATVASGATFATVYIVKLISDYKTINYSVIIVFSTLLIAYIVVLIYSISTLGFDFTKLTSNLIFIGSLILGCFMATEE